MAISMPKGSKLGKPISFSMPARRQSGVPKSPADRLWLIGGCVAGAFILLITYVALISPQRSSTAQVNSQASDAQSTITGLQARINVLQSQYKDLPKYQRELAAARQALPAASGVSAFLRTLQSIGAATSTSVSALTVGVPTALPAAAPVPGATVSPSPAAATPAAGTAAAPIVGQVYYMPITGQVNGTAANLDRFLAQLQQVQPRAVLITQITESLASSTVGAKSANGTVLALSMLAFIEPSTGGSTPTAAGA